MLENYYKKIEGSSEKAVRDLLKKPKNPGYGKTHMISILPVRIVCVGPSGSGKSSSLLSFLTSFSGTFTRIILCCQDSDEPLYNYLKMKMSEIEFFEGIENVPDINDIEPDGQTLIIFDDFANESRKAHFMIEQYYLRGRKKNISSFYLSQNFFNLSKLIRGNLSHCIFKTLSNVQDLKLCIRQYSLGDLNGILNLYKYCNNEFENFFLLSLIDGEIYKGFMTKLN